MHKKTQTLSRSKQPEKWRRTSCRSWVSSKTSILFLWRAALFYIHQKLFKRTKTVCSWKDQLFPNDQGILRHLGLPTEERCTFGATMVSPRAAAVLSNWEKSQLSPLEESMGKRGCTWRRCDIASPAQVDYFCLLKGMLEQVCSSCFQTRVGRVTGWVTVVKICLPKGRQKITLCKLSTPSFIDVSFNLEKEVKQ